MPSEPANGVAKQKDNKDDQAYHNALQITEIVGRKRSNFYSMDHENC
jgi:hypothetical protein